MLNKKWYEKQLGLILRFDDNKIICLRTIIDTLMFVYIRRKYC
jgi:hypothetical protein